MENQLKGGKIFLLIHGFRGFPPWLASSIAYRSVERQLERPGTRHDPQVVATVTHFLQLGPTS